MNENKTAVDKYAFYKATVKAIEYFTKELEYNNRYIEQTKKRLEEAPEDTYLLHSLQEYVLDCKACEQMLEVLNAL